MVKNGVQIQFIQADKHFATTVYSGSSFFLQSQVKYIGAAKYSFTGGTPSTLGNVNSTASLVTHHDSSHSSWQKSVLQL